jgi:hypothetical protein
MEFYSHQTDEKFSYNALTFIGDQHMKGSKYLKLIQLLQGSIVRLAKLMGVDEFSVNAKVVTNGDNKTMIVDLKSKTFTNQLSIPC